LLERRLNRSEVRTQALAHQFDQVAMEGGFDLIVLTGESGETISTGSVMDRAGADALSVFGAAALQMHRHLNGLLPPENGSEIHVGTNGGSRIHMKFFRFRGQRLVVAGRAFKPICDPALLNRLCTGAKRILEARDMAKD
jgi:hypothetical protein